MIPQKEYTRAEEYRQYIVVAGDAWDIDISIICGVISRESRFGFALTPPFPSGVGDGGHGRGLMQIDDQWHKDFIASEKWKLPQANIYYGTKLLADNREMLKKKYPDIGTYDLTRGFIAAFNCGFGNVIKAIKRGKDIDSYTTGEDYSMDVLDRAEDFQKKGWI